jgi:hypothetical protein
MRDPVAKLAAAVFMLSCSLACQGSLPEPPAKVSWANEIARNRSLWAAANLSDYRVKIHWRAAFQNDPPVVVSVNAGRVVSVVYAETGVTPAASDATRLGKSIDEVFDILADADRRPLASITATFDSKLGYPVRFNINWNRTVTDATERAELELQGA